MEHSRRMVAALYCFCYTFGMCITGERLEAIGPRDITPLFQLIYSIGNSNHHPGATVYNLEQVQ